MYNSSLLTIPSATLLKLRNKKTKRLCILRQDDNKNYGKHLNFNHFNINLEKKVHWLMELQWIYISIIEWNLVLCIIMWANLFFPKS